MNIENAHVMIDLETLGKGSYAAIWQVAAVKFNPFHMPETEIELKDTTESFEVTLESCATDIGMGMDVDTVMWWMSPDRNAGRAVIRLSEPVPTVNALEGFAEWFGDDKPVWGNGATFDNVILSNAFGRLGATRPWGYKMDRCYRTLKALAPFVKPFDVGTAHTAVGDALAQAWHLQRIVRHLGLTSL